MTLIPERLSDLLSPEKKAFGSLALTLTDGSPQVTPIWFDWDGTTIILNTARGRVKDKVMHRRGKVALSIADPSDPYRYLQIRGRVVDETEEGAYNVICDLRLKYHGDRNFPKNPGEVRVTYKVLPEQVFPKR
jgi:PPOX class probable F420-dependent enzyme